MPTPSKNSKQPYYATPFKQYFKILDEIDKGKRDTDEFGSILILGLVEEIGEMARAYLAKHGRKKSNLAAQADETYEQELGDILLTILRFARIKKINLDERMMYSLNKVRDRKKNPKQA
ncbi:MAG: MazG protein [Patescibacteria group bacterium]|nr:MazG protein [Patescibacteria group bacterium]